MSEPSAEFGATLAAPAPRQRRRNVAIMAGAALAIILAVTALVYAIHGPSPRGLMAAFSGPGGQATCSAAFSPDGTMLAVAGCGDSVSLWDIATRRQTATLTSPGCPYNSGLRFSPDGMALAVFSQRGISLSGPLRSYHPTTCLWDVSARRETTLTDPPLMNAFSTWGAFSPDGTMLAVADNSGDIYLWNLAARRVTATVPASGYCAPACPVAFSPDGTVLAVGETEPGDDDSHVYLWDLAARRWAGALTEPGGTIVTLSFGRNGILAVGADNDQVFLWDVAAGRLAGTIAPPINVAAGNASISKDGRPYPAAGAYDKVTMAAFSPDGTTLAIDASFGYGTYLYDVATRSRVATLTYPGGGTFHFDAGVVFSPDGTTIAVTEARGPTYLWRVPRLHGL